jgi:hypothetical protein
MADDPTPTPPATELPPATGNPAAPTDPTPEVPVRVDPFQAARERLERGEPLVPVTEEEGDAEEDEAEEPGSEEETEEAEESADSGTEGEEGDSEGAEDESAGEGAEEEAGSGPSVVALPGREPGDPDVEIEVEDPEVAERLRQLRNGFRRGEQVRQEREAVEADRAALREWHQTMQDVKRDLEIDPVGFILSDVEEVPLKAEILAALLVDDELMKSDAARTLLDRAAMGPEELADLRRDVEHQRTVRELDRVKDEQVRRAHREGALQTLSRMEQFIPEDFEDDVGFRKQATKVLGTLAGETGRTVFSLAEIRSALDRAGTFAEFGVDPDSANLENSASQGGDRPRAKGKVRRATAAQVRTAKPDPETTGKTAASMKKKSTARKAAATVAPAGAGAPVARVEVPSGQGVKDRIAWARKVGLGAATRK